MTSLRLQQDKGKDLVPGGKWEHNAVKGGKKMEKRPIMNRKGIDMKNTVNQTEMQSSEYVGNNAETLRFLECGKLLKEVQ